MRISDWSSYVCSSDLPAAEDRRRPFSGQFEQRRDPVRRHRFEARPAVGAEPFERAEARLIGHAGRTFDPVTEIDIRQSGPRGALEMVEDERGAQSFARGMRRVEAPVAHRQPVAPPFGNAAAATETAAAAARLCSNLAP